MTLKEVNQRYYEKHRVVILEKRYQSYRENRDKILKAKRLAYESRKPTILERIRKRYWFKREEILEQKKEHYKEQKQIISEKRSNEWKQLRDDIIIFLTGSNRHICMKCGRLECENEIFEFAHLTRNKWLVKGLPVWKKDEFVFAPDHFLYLCHNCHGLFDSIVYWKKKTVLKTDDDIARFGWVWVNRTEELPLICGNQENLMKKREFFERWGVSSGYTNYETL